MNGNTIMPTISSTSINIDIAVIYKNMFFCSFFHFEYDTHNNSPVITNPNKLSMAIGIKL